MGYLTRDLPPELQQHPLDVFISYSHGTFYGSTNNTLQTWSRQLADDLREELEVSGISPLSLFIDSEDRPDESIDLAEPLSEQLRKRVEGAAVLTALISHYYLRSKWCTDERRWWSRCNRTDPLGVGARLFPCRVLSNHKYSWPEELEDRLGYFFYDKDNDDPRPFTWDGRDDDRNQYVRMLLRLAGDIARRLKAAREVLDERHRQWDQQRKTAADRGQAIFLHARPEAETAWSKACNRLQEQGRFGVNPDRPVPMDNNGGLDPESRCQLYYSDALLLLGTEDRRALDSDITVIGHHVRNLAVAERRTALPCAVLDIVPDPPPEDPRRRNAENLGIGWLPIDINADDWPDRVRGWLRQEA